MFVVITQILENYGAHCEDGKFESGNAYWKFKGGDTYLVEDLDREQDAIAFVAALVMENDIGYKEYPAEVMTWNEYWDSIKSDEEDYQNFQLDRIQVVSPCSPGEVGSFKDSEWDMREDRFDIA